MNHLGTDPSFFELFMADRLQRSITPALGQVTQGMAARLGPGPANASAPWARIMLRAKDHVDEVGTLLLAVLQALSLRRKGEIKQSVVF